MAGSTFTTEQIQHAFAELFDDYEGYSADIERLDEYCAALEDFLCRVSSILVCPVASSQ